MRRRAFSTFSVNEAFPPSASAGWHCNAATMPLQATLHLARQFAPQRVSHCTGTMLLLPSRCAMPICEVKALATMVAGGPAPTPFERLQSHADHAKEMRSNWAGETGAAAAHRSSDLHKKLWLPFPRRSPFTGDVKQLYHGFRVAQLKPGLTLRRKALAVIADLFSTCAKGTPRVSLFGCS